MEKLLTAEEVALLIPSKRKGATVHTETIMNWYRQGVTIGNRHIQLLGKSVPGRVVFTESDVQRFIEEITAAKAERKKKTGPKKFLQSRGIIP